MLARVWRVYGARMARDASASLGLGFHQVIQFSFRPKGRRQELELGQIIQGRFDLLHLVFPGCDLVKGEGENG